MLVGLLSERSFSCRFHIKISIKEYEDMQLKVGDKVTIQVKKSREYWSLTTHRLTIPLVSMS